MNWIMSEPVADKIYYFVACIKFEYIHSSSNILCQSYLYLHS